MRICLQCSRLHWTRTDSLPPVWIWPLLRDTIRQAGFEPKRDWRDWRDRAVRGAQAATKR